MNEEIPSVLILIFKNGQVIVFGIERDLDQVPKNSQLRSRRIKRTKCSKKYFLCNEKYGPGPYFTFYGGKKWANVTKLFSGQKRHP